MIFYKRTEKLDRKEGLVSRWLFLQWEWILGDDKKQKKTGLQELKKRDEELLFLLRSWGAVICLTNN
jgi:hypothetical protein